MTFLYILIKLHLFATKLGQGNIFRSVSRIMFTEEGVCLSACWDSRPPWEQTPSSWEQTPPTRSRQPPYTMHTGRYGQQVCGTHPTGMQSCFYF